MNWATPIWETSGDAMVDAHQEVESCSKQLKCFQWVVTASEFPDSASALSHVNRFVAEGFVQGSLRLCRLCPEQPTFFPLLFTCFGDCDTRLPYRPMAYRYEATSVEGFIQQLAVSYVRHGYYFYVTGVIPEGKPVHAVDAKLIERYGIAVSKWTRARRKRLGLANIQYVRHEGFFLLLATHGAHPFFEHERERIRDARRVPIKYKGYSVSFRSGHAHVRIEQQEYMRVRDQSLGLAKNPPCAHIVHEFGRLPYEPFAPIRRQLLSILRAVNRSRRKSGYPPIPTNALRLRRRIVRPFGNT